MEAGRADDVLLATLRGERSTVIGRADEVLIGTLLVFPERLLFVDGYEPTPAPGTEGEGGHAMLTAEGRVESLRGARGGGARAVMSAATLAVRGVSARSPRSLSLSMRSVRAMP